MKRENLFRGQTEDGEWFYGHSFKWVNDNHYITTIKKNKIGMPVTVRVKEKTVTQFTGLYDATKWEDLTDEERKAWTIPARSPCDWKGKRIFEGDILEYRGKKCRACGQTTYNNHSPYPVTWDKKEACFKAENDDNWMDTCVWKDMFVIGNVFDNSDLLEKNA